MKRLLLPVLALAIVAAGCKPASLAGTYKGPNSELELKDDGGFTVKPSANPAASTTGKWKEESGKVSFTPEQVMGKPVADLAKQLDQAKAFLKPEQIATAKAALNGFDGTVSQDRKSISVSVAGQAATFTKS